MINAVEFGLNVQLSVVVEFICELRPKLALVEGTLEVVHPDYTTDQEKSHWYHQNIEEARYGHEKRLDTYFETFVSGNDSQGAEDT